MIGTIDFDFRFLCSKCLLKFCIMAGVHTNESRQHKVSIINQYQSICEITFAGWGQLPSQKCCNEWRSCSVRIIHHCDWTPPVTIGSLLFKCEMGEESGREWKVNLALLKSITLFTHLAAHLIFFEILIHCSRNWG